MLIKILKNKLRHIKNLIIEILIIIIFTNQAYSNETKSNNNTQFSDYTIKTEKITSIYERPYSFWNNHI